MGNNRCMRLTPRSNEDKKSEERQKCPRSDNSEAIIQLAY